MKLTRKAREQARHGRAVVRQELGAVADACAPAIHCTCKTRQGRKYCKIHPRSA